MEQQNETLLLLSEKLGVAVDYVMTALTKQAAVESVSLLLLFSLVFLALIAAGWGIRKLEKWADEEPGEVWVYYVIGSFLLFVSFLSSLDAIVTGFVNPEYWAIEEAVSLLRRI